MLPDVLRALDRNVLCPGQAFAMSYRGLPKRVMGIFLPVSHSVMWCPGLYY